MRLINQILTGRQLLCVVALCGTVTSTAVCAQHAPPLDRVSLWLGGYYATSDTTVYAASKGDLVSGNLNLEDDLGFKPRKVTPRVRLDLLVGDKQGFSLDFYRYERTRDKSLSRSITYDGTTYDAAAKVHGDLNFDFGSVAYRWWFGSGDDVFGLGLGASYYRVKAGVRGQASLNDHRVHAETSTEANAWAPLLQIGWRHAFNDRWRMYFDASGVLKNGGNLDGHIYNASLGVQWFPWKNIGLSAEYGISRIRLHQQHHRYNDSLDLKLDGPSLFAIFRF